MRIRFLKGVVSTYGGFDVGNIADIPDEVAQVWCEAGIAIKDKCKIPKEKPEVIPNGMFWCNYCRILHQIDSKIGKRHQKYNERVL